MKVFKFGGASVKDAGAVRNVARILSGFSNQNLVVVISAMGKTTNALEKVLSSWYASPESPQTLIEPVRNYHQEILEELFPDPEHVVYAKTEAWFSLLLSYLSGSPSGNYDFDYDQVVSIGELLSTTIVAEHLHDAGLSCKWLDIRPILRTDSTWREGRVDWGLTVQAIRNSVSAAFDPSQQGVSIIITQGFLGSTDTGYTTTLGREGSDYTAAILSHSLEAGEMIIWKDVPGLLNADPKYFSKTEKLDSISYREAIELAYYGATIIHPKTIKPLQNKGIPLFIKSFVDSDGVGSVIHENTSADALIPSFIFKVNQVLISISPRDFSFIDEQNLSDILAVFADMNIHVHLMQNTALSFSVCVDHSERKLPELFRVLNEQYRVKYNTGLELITIRHYDQATIDRVMEDGKTILLEMRSRVTAQFVVRPNN